MMKVVYNDILVDKAVIWVIFGISLWKEKEALIINTNDTWLARCEIENINKLAETKHEVRTLYLELITPQL